MKRKRFIKLCMGKLRIERNGAVMIADLLKKGVSYSEVYPVMERMVQDTIRRIGPFADDVSVTIGFCKRKKE